MRWFGFAMMAGSRFKLLEASFDIVCVLTFEPLPCQGWLGSPCSCQLNWKRSSFNHCHDHCDQAELTIAIIIGNIAHLKSCPPPAEDKVEKPQVNSEKKLTVSVSAFIGSYL